MQDIYSLIQCLSSREWESFQNYLTCFSSHAKDEGGLKQLKLAAFLRENSQCPIAQDACLKIYNDLSSNAIENLKSRLKEKVFDFLLTDISPDKKNELDESDLTLIRIKKKSALFQQLFYSKSRMPFLYTLLDEIILSAKEYEQYYILVEHLKAKKNLVSFKISEKAFDKISAEIDLGLICMETCKKAEHYYYKLMMANDFTSKANIQKLLPNIKRDIAEVKNGFEETGSPLVKYFLKNLEMGYFQIQENYIKARSTCLELLNVVRNNKSVYRRQRVGVVYDNLSRCEYYLGNYAVAVNCAQEAQKVFTPNSENYCIALEQEFYASLALNRLDESFVLAEKMLESATRKELGEFRYSKYNYLLANVLFKQKRFKESLAILSEEREISKDKAGWETGARILTIMTLIEMAKLDEASLAVYSLRQFFKRADKKTPISKRDKTILNLLLIVERAGFMFNKLNASAQKHIATLNSNTEAVRWEPFTHELIPFQEWIAGKMKIQMPSTATLVQTSSKKKVSAL